MLPQPICALQCSPKLLLILPRFLYLPHAFPTPALGSFVFLPPLDSGVSTEQVMGKGDVKIPLAFRAARASLSKLRPGSRLWSCASWGVAPFAPAPRMPSRTSIFLQWLCQIWPGRAAVACYSWCLVICPGLLGSSPSAHAMNVKAAPGAIG